MSSLPARLLFALALSSAPAAADEPAATKPYDYLRTLIDAENGVRQALAGVDDANPEARRAVLRAYQLLASERAQVGDYPGAIETHALSLATYRGGDPPAADAAADREHVRRTLEKFAPEPAVAAIVRMARDRRIVVLNEAHHSARHRAFGLELARALRAEGFRILAMETLARDTGSLARRGYPVIWSGWYTREPVFGDFLRQALRLGYEPVAYEIGTDDPRPKSSSMFDTIDAREEAQATNLVARALAKDPQARVFVYVGQHHLYKGFGEVEGRKLAWMAERLRAKAGTEPLCVDQAKVIEPEPGSRDRALVDALFDGRDDDSVVLAERGTPGAFHVFDAARVDMQVFHRPTRIVKGRPDWLAMHGYRRPRAIPAKLLPREGRRLVQAFFAAESGDVVPVDQVLVTAGEKPPVLMLPKGEFRFAFQE